MQATKEVLLFLFNLFVSPSSILFVVDFEKNGRAFIWYQLLSLCFFYISFFLLLFCLSSVDSKNHNFTYPFPKIRKILFVELLLLYNFCGETKLSYVFQFFRFSNFHFLQIPCWCVIKIIKISYVFCKALLWVSYRVKHTKYVFSCFTISYSTFCAQIFLYS